MIHKNLTQDNINLHNASENSQDSYLSLNRSKICQLLLLILQFLLLHQPHLHRINQGDTNKNNSIYPSI